MTMHTSHTTVQIGHRSTEMEKPIPAATLESIRAALQARHDAVPGSPCMAVSGRHVAFIARGTRDK